MDTFKLQDVNDVTVEIPFDQLRAIARDYTTGFQVGYGEAFSKAYTKSALITLGFVAVTTVALIGIDQTIGRRKTAKLQQTKE